MHWARLTPFSTPGASSKPSPRFNYDLSLGEGLLEVPGTGGLCQVGPSFGVPPACIGRKQSTENATINRLCVLGHWLCLCIARQRQQQTDIKSTRKAMINWLVCCGAEAAMWRTFFMKKVIQRKLVIFCSLIWFKVVLYFCHSFTGGLQYRAIIIQNWWGLGEASQLCMVRQIWPKDNWNYSQPWRQPVHSECTTAKCWSLVGMLSRLEP